MQKAQNSQINIEGEQSQRTDTTQFNLYYKSIANKTVPYWYENG